MKGELETCDSLGAGLLDALEAALRTLGVLAAGKAEREARRSMAGLRGWK